MVSKVYFITAVLKRFLFNFINNEKPLKIHRAKLLKI